MSREAVVVPEKQEKIEKIKAKYNNMAMSDESAKKIQTLEVANNILIAATAVSGIAAVVNHCVPDPVPFLDEVILDGFTGLCFIGERIIDNKIDDIARTGSTELKAEEVQVLANQMMKIKSAKEAKAPVKAA